MAKRLELIELDEDVLLAADYPDDEELSTNRLASGKLASQQSIVEEIDWLLKLRTKKLATRQLGEDALRPELRPSGMSAHAAPARIVPTRGARFRIGLRRGTLMVLLAALAASVLAGGGYLLASTSWLSSLFSVAAPAAAPQTGGASVPNAQTNPPPAPQAGQPVQDPSLQSDPAAPQQPAGGNTASAKDSSALAGLDARNLREKGIEAYKAGKYTDAVSLLEQSVLMAPDDPVAEYQLGLASMAVQGRQHSLDDAELAFRSAISLQPHWSAPYQMMAETLMRRGYYEQAVPPALEATQLDPTMGQAWMTLGRAYSGAGKDAQATKAFAEAAKYAPAPPPGQP